MEKISRNDCGVFLAAFIEKNDLSVKKVSNAITCSQGIIESNNWKPNSAE